MGVGRRGGGPKLNLIFGHIHSLKLRTPDNRLNVLLIGLLSALNFTFQYMISHCRNSRREQIIYVELGKSKT